MGLVNGTGQKGDKKMKEHHLKIGSIVHYNNYQNNPRKAGVPQPAMVTMIWYKTSEDCDSKENLSPVDVGFGVMSCDLIIFSSIGFFFNKHVKQDELYNTGGTWHWPK